MQISMGLEGVDIISVDEVLNIVPQLNTEDVVGGSFCPSDGFVDPYSVMTGFTARARQRGVKLWVDTEVTGIYVDDSGRIAGVQTTRGNVATRNVVNAAGAWAAKVAKLVNVELPVKPLKRQLVNTQPFDLLPARLPMVIDMSNGFHFRREGPGILMAWSGPDETSEFNTTFNPQFIEDILIRAVARVPCFAETEVNPSRCWAGLYEMTPDHHAIIGPAPGVAGLFFANGFSGHGVMHSPATGKIISELIMYGESRTIDARPLGVERFAEGRLLEETAVL